MDWKYEERPTLTWADSYEDAEEFVDERHEEDDDKTIQNLTDAHELWMALLKSWTEIQPWYPPSPDRG